MESLCATWATLFYTLPLEEWPFTMRPESNIGQRMGMSALVRPEGAGQEETLHRWVGRASPANSRGFQSAPVSGIWSEGPERADARIAVRLSVYSVWRQRHFGWYKDGHHPRPRGT